MGVDVIMTDFPEKGNQDFKNLAVTWLNHAKEKERCSFSFKSIFIQLINERSLNRLVVVQPFE
ncbi:hypothetical protein KEH51_26630, partial [[Brevibacterium] frigoritolerans]|nr:hypothetical protein [Peribacillus frigoritolerans]